MSEGDNLIIVGLAHMQADHNESFDREKRTNLLDSSDFKSGQSEIPGDAQNGITVFLFF
jgi:hypothetical protein